MNEGEYKVQWLQNVIENSIKYGYLNIALKYSTCVNVHSYILPLVILNLTLRFLLLLLFAVVYLLQILVSIFLNYLEMVSHQF